ncbi:hypothetical protein [Microbispora bryophytorum]|nr:hypothetical protein [Microbispora bryophytorum]MBD3137158.1 hypothetical protein [Microbispora bryophytorum]TQS06636.1 hypothetical protein FLX07_12130 [Microbispora bryophytorum]
MATSRRGTCGSTAFTLVVGLLMLALALVASTPAWYGGDPAQRMPQAAAEVWTPGAWTPQSATLPTGAAGPEHLPFPSRPHNVAAAPAAPVSAPAQARHHEDIVLSPQQTGHRTAGSRSPPQSL